MNALVPADALPADEQARRPANDHGQLPTPCDETVTRPGFRRGDDGDRPRVVLLLGPHREAVSGVSTHLNLLFASKLAQAFRLKHFQVGSEGRDESVTERIFRLLASPLKLAAAIVFGRVDVVHLNTSLNRRAYWRDLAYLLVAKLCGAQVVYQVHGGDLPPEFSRRNRLLAAGLRLSLRLPDTIVVLARSELAAYREFVPEQRAVVVPNAVDMTTLYSPSARRARNPQAPLELLYIGRLAREKGLFDALKGLRIARSQGSDACWVIAGSGPDEAPLRHFVADLHLADAVRFIGPAFGEAKNALLANADVLLMPTWAEGLPYALLECMAAGMPAITTRVGAIPDVVGDGVHGIFVPRGDANAIGQAILTLDRDRTLLAAMGTACRQRIAANYHLDRLAESLAGLYADPGGARQTTAAAES